MLFINLHTFSCRVLHSGCQGVAKVLRDGCLLVLWCHWWFTCAYLVGWAAEATAAVGGCRHNDGVLHATLHTCEVTGRGGAIAGKKGAVLGLCCYNVERTSSLCSLPLYLDHATVARSHCHDG